MKKLPYAITAAIALLIAVIAFSQYKKSHPTSAVQLSPELRTAYEEKFAEYDKKLAVALKMYKGGEEKPDIDLFIEKARYQEYLGLYGDAVDTLLLSFQYYENTSVGWNNIARLYDKMGEYELALKFYKKLIDVFNIKQYYLDAAWDYYRLGMMKEARDAYGLYTQLTNQNDPEFVKILEQLAKS